MHQRESSNLGRRWADGTRDGALRLRQLRGMSIASSWTLVAALMLAGWVTAPGTAAGSPIRQTEPLATRSCEGAAPPAPQSGQMHTMTQDAPAGVQMTPLAEQQTGTLPDQIGTVQLSRLHLEPGYGSDTLRASGPILFYVESGNVTLFINGARHEASAGVSVLVEEHNEYALEQAGGDPARLLRLGIVPNGSGAQEIAVFQRPSDVDTPRSDASPRVDYLVLGQSIDLPSAPSVLALACLGIPAGFDTAGDLLHDGTVGIYIEQGPLGLFPDVEQQTRGCAIFPAGAPHDLRAPDVPAAALVFAVLPEGSSFWAEGLQPGQDGDWRDRYVLDCDALEGNA